MLQSQRLKGKLELRTLADGHDEYRQVLVRLDAEDVAPMVINLALLAFRLVDGIRLVRDQAQLVITSGEEHILSVSGSSYRLRVSEPALTNLTAFMLIYVRDGAADVDHVDIETQSEGALSSDVTFIVDAAKPSMSGDQLRELLLNEEP